MQELQTLFHTLQLKNVHTYIQSGNVIFEGKDQDPTELAAKIRTEVKDQFGIDSTVLVLGKADFEKAMQSNPFTDAENVPKSLHLYFASEAPEKPDLELLRRIRTDTEQFELRGKILYLLAPDGIGRSKLASTVEKALGVPVTARNWRTVSKIMEMANQ